MTAAYPNPVHLATLTNLAVICARGADAASFLHSQLTQDIQTLPDDAARLAGYCTAKGRLLATMVVWREPDGENATPQLRMLVRADLAESLVKRLAMFVLRAKVKLAVEPVTVTGVMYDTAAAQPEPEVSGEPWQCARTSSSTKIIAPCADPQRTRAWWLGDPPTESIAMDASAWDAADIAAGLPWIEAATQDLFIPQTLNLDVIGAVSFTKGCYPGQEVVARSHYRGTVKRRMAGGVVASTSTDVAAATDVYTSENPDAPCGRIINAARVDDMTHVLFEAPLDAVATERLQVGSADGLVITQLQTWTV